MPNLAEARRKAWETRRAIYGSIGHGGSYNRAKFNVGRMITLLVRLHVEGVLSEGQIAKATGLGRVEIRKLAQSNGELS